jgi:N-acylneuraminate cytidylyltransferase/CMP-N,N'-diacetyllegionaminic acid synthase
VDNPVILAAICARGGSKGVPRKNLREVGGKPLLAHAIACAQACSFFSDIVVSTDDPEIAAVGRRCGAQVPFLRPAVLARDDASKWPVFRHLVGFWEHETGLRVAALVDLDVGVPLRTPEDVRGCVDALMTSNADVVATAYDAERNPYFNMVEVAGNGYATLAKPTSPPIACRQAAPPVYSLSPAVYAIARDALWSYEHWSEARLRVHIIPRARAVDIDTELDLHFVEYLMSHAGATA